MHLTFWDYLYLLWTFIYKEPLTSLLLYEEYVCRSLTGILKALLPINATARAESSI